MQDLLTELLGEYYYNFVIITSSLPTLLFALLLFSRGMTKRRLFPLRLLVSVALMFAVFFGIAVLRTRLNNIYTRLVVYVATTFLYLPLLLFCFDESWINRLLAWCAAVAADDIGNRVFTLLIILLGKDPLGTISLFSDANYARDWLFFYLIRFSVELILYCIFRQAKCLEADRNSIRNITGLSVFFAVWMVLMQAFSRQYMQESGMLYAVITVNAAAFSFAVLLLRTGILSQNRYKQEIAMTERLLREERKQYDSVKENIELVNMRCHDLKHQLEDLSYKLTEGELNQLKEALKFYDSSLKTGSEVLDVVIYEKQPVFQKENIRFTCLADGKLLSFMRTTHVYAFFNNALGNALEAVRKVGDPEKKIIDLSIRGCGESLEITVTNYFDGKTAELGSTTKDDKNRHGFGVRSMKYIAEQYGGSLRTGADGEVFELCCTIPLPKQ